MYFLCSLYTDLFSQLGGQNKVEICSVAVFNRGAGTASSADYSSALSPKGKHSSSNQPAHGVP